MTRYIVIQALILGMILTTSSASAERFTLHGDGTVTDAATGLMWLRTPTGQPGSWAEALSNCENLTYAGFSDWRLPNIKELHSLYDLSRSAPALDPSYFAHQADFWNGRNLVEASSTTNPKYPIDAYCVAVTNGAITSCPKNGGFVSNQKASRCVRGE